MTTATAATRKTRRRSIGRVVVGLLVFVAFTAGVPAVLWRVPGNGPLPDPGPGGWAEVRAQLAAGRLPDGAVLAAAVTVGWLIWTYLLTMALAEIAAGWRDRKHGIERASQLSGPRRVIARLVGWVFAGHTMVAGMFIVPSSGMAPIAHIAVVDEQVSTVGPDPVDALAVVDPGGFDPNAYVNFDVTEPEATGPAGGDETGRSEAVERQIVPGDTLWDIAEELTGDGMNWPAIWDATDLGAQQPPVDSHNPDLIFPGNVVRIPSRLIPDPVVDQLLGAAAEPNPADAATEPSDSTEAAAPVPLPPAPEATASTSPVPADLSGATDDDTPAEVLSGGIPTSGGRGVLLPGAVLGLGGAAGAVVLAGLARRRNRAMAASRRGQRPPRQAKQVARASRRITAAVAEGMWSPQDLAASWNSLHPANPGSRQPWCVRWNSALRVLECAWTPDPDSAGPGSADPSGAQPPAPGPGSPWKLVPKQDRAGRSVSVWTITETDVPARPARDVVPAMVGCAYGRNDRLSTDGFFINLEAAGIITVESSKPDLIDPEGTVRALLLQLQANGTAEVHLLNTDLGLNDLAGPAVHVDPIAMESQLVAELTDHQSLWDGVPSMFAARSDEHYTGPVIVVAGPSEDLQSCSHLLSLARAENVPLVVIGIGPLAHAWASFHLEPEPDKHTIRFPAARAVLSFDHLSWVSAEEATDLVDLISSSSRPWVDVAHPTPHEEPDEIDPIDDSSPLSAASTVANSLAADSIDLDPDPLLSTDPDWGGAGSTASEAVEDDGLWPAGRDSSSGFDLGDLDAAEQPEALDDLWSILPAADPTTLADQASGLDADDIDWAVVGDDAEIDHLLDSNLDDLLGTGPATDGAGDPEDDDEVLLITSPWTDPELDDDPALSSTLTSACLGGGPSSTALNGRGHGPSTIRLDRVGSTTTADPDLPAPDGDDDGHRGPVLTVPATSAGLRLELCGPIRLMQLSDKGTELAEVPISAAGVTGAQLALLAYLVVAGRPSGGVGREQIAVEFWPDVHGDGTSRVVQPATVKRRMVELRSRLAKLATGNDGKALLPEAVDGRYRLCLASDWHDVREALLKAESSNPGDRPWTEAIATIISTVRPPGLLTPPGGSRQLRHFAWVDDHYHSLVQDLARRVLAVLADQAGWQRGLGQCEAALEVLSLARSIAPMYPREIADGVVATYLALGDPVRAEQECSAYERQFDENFLTRERQHPQPGNPRVRLNEYLNHQHTGAEE